MPRKRKREIERALDEVLSAIYAEHVPAEIQKFKRPGWSVKKAEKDIDAGIAEVRRRLDTDGNLGVDIPKRRFAWGKQYQGAEADSGPDPEHGSRVGLFVADPCVYLIREFFGYKEEHVGTDAAVDHCLDSIRYLTIGVSGGPQVIKRTTGDWGRVQGTVCRRIESE